MFAFFKFYIFVYIKLGKKWEKIKIWQDVFLSYITAVEVYYINVIFTMVLVYFNFLLYKCSTHFEFCLFYLFYPCSISTRKQLPLYYK